VYIYYISVAMAAAAAAAATPNDVFGCSRGKSLKAIK
jgi:hypothetical protein